MNFSTVENWYAGLAQREQRIVALGAAAAAVLLLLAIVLPLHSKAVALEQRIATKQTDLAWMQAVAPALMAAGPLPAAANPQESLVVLVDRSARESGLAQSLTGSQPSGDGATGSLSMRLRETVMAGTANRPGLSRSVAMKRTPCPANSIICGRTIERRNLYGEELGKVEGLKVLLDQYKARGRSTPGPPQTNASAKNPGKKNESPGERSE